MLFENAKNSLYSSILSSKCELTEQEMHLLKSRLSLEHGLAEHHFNAPSQGKENFVRAKEESGLKVKSFYRFLPFRITF